ncbi:PREDICTED: uncharacterized protein LOC104813683 [Tarenaya hassleriana]|uniref:uncharacterized protein LOC104813683 n=1 Tax=Tarenaya hassleriana TaxID=28532 RepID=UPI00053C30A5|nr:PREDICTED: uncharacterized protein LOC104813683 [Tarenaya hassleriana]
MEITVGVRRKRGRPRKRQGAEEANRSDLKILGNEIVEIPNTDSDSQYLHFLQNIASDESQLVFEYTEGDRETRFLTYEVDDKPLEYTLTRNGKKKSRDSRERRNAEKEMTFSASKRLWNETPRIVPEIQKGKGNVRIGRKSLVSRKNVELEDKSTVSCKRKRLSEEELKVDSCKIRSGKYPDMEDYRFFLGYMMDTETNPSNTHQNVPQGKRIEKTEVSFVPEIVAVDDHPFSDGDDNPFVAAKSRNVIDIDETNGGSGRIRNSWLREKVMDALRKPYSEKELYKLCRAASIRKPKIRERELRNGRTLSYTVGDLGKSVLHHHPDFSGLFLRRFGSAKFKYLLQLPLKDRHGALNLLRGLFFYIKYACHDDAFRPWMDDECLRTMLCTPSSANGHSRRNHS